MSDILVFTPPVSEAICGVPNELAEICGWLHKEGYDFDQKCLGTLSKSINRGNFREDHIDLDVYEDNDRLLDYLLNGENQDISKIAKKFGNLLDIASYDIIIVVAPTEFIAPSKDLYLIRSLPILKEAAKNKTTIIGGLESETSKNSARLSYIDYVIRGDMELPLSKILKHELDEQVLGNCPGLYYAKGDELKENGSYSHPVNEKATPYFEPEILDQMRDYFAFKYLIIPYKLGRGCSQNCSFCSLFEDQNFDYKDVDKVVSDLKVIKEKTGSTKIWFTDRNLFNNPDYMYKLAERLIEEDLDLSWSGMSIIVPRNQEYYNKLSESGCVALQHGIESVSDSVLHRMRKSQTKSMIEDVLKKESKAGIKPYGLFITDYIDESWSEYNETIEFIEDNKELRGGRVASLNVYATERQPIYKNPEEFGVELTSKSGDNWIKEALDQSVSFSDSKDLDESEKRRIRRFKERYFNKKIGYELFLKNYMLENPVRGLQFQFKNFFGDYEGDISHYYV